MWKHFRRNWKTTVSGVLVLAACGVKLYEDPKMIADPAMQAAVVSGVGLVVASDSRAPDVEAPKS